MLGPQIKLRPYWVNNAWAELSQYASQCRSQLCKNIKFRSIRLITRLSQSAFNWVFLTFALNFSDWFEPHFLTVAICRMIDQIFLHGKCHNGVKTKIYDFESEEVFVSPVKVIPPRKKTKRCSTLVTHARMAVCGVDITSAKPYFFCSYFLLREKRLPNVLGEC